MSKRRKVIGINAPSEGVEDAINSNLTLQALGKTSQLLEETMNSIKASGGESTTTSIEGNVQRAHGIVQAIKTLNEQAMNNKFQNDKDKVKNHDIAEKELAVIHQSIVNGEDPLLLKNYKEQVQNCTSLHIDTYRRIHFPSDNEQVASASHGLGQAQPEDGGGDVGVDIVDFDVNTGTIDSANANANILPQATITSPSTQPYSDMMSAHSKAQELAVVAFLLPKPSPSQTGGATTTTTSDTTNALGGSHDPAQVQVQAQQMASPTNNANVHPVITAAAVAAAAPSTQADATAAAVAVPSQSPYTDLLNAHAKTTGTRRSRSRPRPQYKRTRQTQSQTMPNNGPEASTSTSSDTTTSASATSHPPPPPTEVPL